MKFLLGFCLLVLFTKIANITAFSSGAPDLACVNRTPNHGGNQPQNRAKPYIVSVNSTIHAPDRPILVTLTGVNSAQFKGFMMQMRTTDTSQALVGNFTIPPEEDDNIQLRTCSGNAAGAVTHKNNSTKSDISVIWSTSDPNVGTVRIVSTVVQQFDTFWLDVQSQTITKGILSDGGGEPPSTTPVAGRPPTDAMSRSTPGCLALLLCTAFLYILRAL